MSHDVIDAAIEVHRVLDPGFLESVCEAASTHELKDQGLGCDRQPPFSISYKGTEVGWERLDPLVEKSSIIEPRTVDRLSPVHEAQILSYLKAMRSTPGLSIDFNVDVLRDGIKRVVHSG